MIKTKINNYQKSPAKLALIALIGIGATLLINHKSFSEMLAPQVGENGLKPMIFEGSVLKTLEEFSFTSVDGVQYHLNDPNDIIDDITQQQNNHQSLYHLDNVRIQGIVSPVGNYGHMGRWERQITVTGVGTPKS